MTPLPLTDMKPVARKVLVREQRPMHYQHLMREMLYDLNIQVGDTEFRKLAEDLREKVLLARAAGLAYTGRPHCLAVLMDWFSNRSLINTYSERIDLSTRIAVDAGSEACLRFQHIDNKFQRSQIDHAKTIMRGLIIERAVSEWFRDKWPYFWLPPENDGDYQRPCPHDFRLRLPSMGMIGVDVAGPNRDGSFGSVRWKPKAQLHVAAEDEGLSIMLCGVISSRTFSTAALVPEQMEPMSKLTVLLNCEGQPYSYLQIAQALGVHFKLAS